jgi:hypothetical protein
MIGANHPQSKNDHRYARPIDEALRQTVFMLGIVAELPICSASKV